MKTLALLKRYGPLLVIGLTFLGSLVMIGASRLRETPQGGITLRLAHWQLEPGVRTAFDAMAADYEKLHPGVRILQEAIPETTYGQWISTQLIGGTAPDIVQIGLWLPPNIWVAYQGRYFEPITRQVNQPNPYNAGTDLAKKPLRLTYKDGMREAYVEELQEFTKVPLAQFGTRVFYNVDLLKKLTGRDHPPSDYRDFLAVCEEIRSKTDAQGKPYVAIAGSKYHFNIFDEMMFQPLTYGGLGKIDYNRDGTADKDETFVGFATNRVSLSTPAYRARLKMAREVGGFCQAGYTGLTRDEGVFLFAQQRAVFIPTGTWDAGSLQEQARGKFAIAVMEFPIPAPDDPEFGRFMPGPRYERPSSQFAFGVTRTSQHKEVALDFLFFLASQKGNEKLNGIIGWIPAIEGTKVDPFLAPFQPHLQGIYAALDLNLGGETWVKWQQLYSLFQVNQISLEDFTAQFDDYYRNRGAVDFAERVNTWRRDAQRYEQLLAGMRAKAMFPASGQDAEQESKWIRYRSATAKQIGREINGNHLLAQIKRGPDATATTPATYEYSPEALAAIRERVRNTPPKKSP